MKSKIVKLVLLSAMLGFGGCASITEGTDQNILVDVDPDNAVCTVTRKGEQLAVIDEDKEIINVSKSRNNLEFDCEAPGYKDGEMIVESSASGMGIVGCFLIDLCVTDYSTGALNKYPDSITIALLKDEDAVLEDQSTTDSTVGAGSASEAGQSEGSIRILLGSFNDQGAAKAKWDQMRATYPDLAAAQGGIVQSQDSVGNVYKLYAQGIPDSRLVKICRDIRSAGSICEPVTF